MEKSPNLGSLGKGGIGEIPIGAMEVVQFHPRPIVIRQAASQTGQNRFKFLKKGVLVKEYMFLFRGRRHDPKAVLNTPEKWQAHLQKWAAWMGDLAKQGKLVSAQPLETDSGKLVRHGNLPATDGPFIEGKEMIVGGYLICRAESYEEAVAISRGCPSLQDFENSLVEVRVVQELKP